MVMFKAFRPDELTNGESLDYKWKPSRPELWDAAVLGCNILSWPKGRGFLPVSFIEVKANWIKFESIMLYYL